MGIIKIVMLGSGGVGKSAVTMQFIQNTFISEYDPTIENSYRKQITIDDKEEMLEILDTAGQEEFSSMRDSHIRAGMGFLIVYSIVNSQSFGDVRDFRDRILQVKDKDYYPFLILGNKCDLAKERQVEIKQGEDLAKEFKVSFRECSAKMKINIDESYKELVRLINKSIEEGLYDNNSGNDFVPIVKKKEKKFSCDIL